MKHILTFSIIAMFSAFSCYSEYYELMQADTIKQGAEDHFFDEKIISLRQEYHIGLDGTLVSRNSDGETDLSKLGLGGKYIDFSIDNIPLNNPYSGRADLSRYFFHNLMIQEKTNSLTKMSFTSDMNKKEDAGDILIGGGNSFGLVSGAACGIYNFFYWAVTGSYITSLGLPKSDKSDSRVYAPTGLIDNSDYELSALTFRAGFEDDNSQVELMAAYFGSDRGLQRSYSNNSIFAKDKSLQNSLFNFKFKSTIDEFLSVGGNVFYVGDKSVRQYYDDSTYTTYKSDSSFRNTKDIYYYGSNINAMLNWAVIPAAKLYAEYRRNVVSVQNKEEFAYRTFETDNASIGCSQAINIAGIGVIGDISYKLTQSLNTEPKSKNMNLSGYEASLVTAYSLNKNLIFKLNLEKKLILPVIEELWNNSDKISILNKDLQPENMYIAGSKFQYSSKYFACSSHIFLRNMQDIISLNMVNDNLLYTNESNRLDWGLNFEIENYLPFLIMKANYTAVQSGKTLIRYPGNMFTVSARNSYNSPIEWKISYSYIGKRYFSEDKKLLCDETSLINFYFAFKVLEKHRMIFASRNISDAFYFLEPGLAGAGREFYLGVALAF